MNPKSAGVDGADKAAANSAGDGGGGFSGTRFMLLDSRVFFGLGGGTGGALNKCSLRGSIAGGMSAVIIMVYKNIRPSNKQLLRNRIDYLQKHTAD